MFTNVNNILWNDIGNPNLIISNTLVFSNPILNLNLNISLNLNVNNKNITILANSDDATDREIVVPKVVG